MLNLPLIPSWQGFRPFNVELMAVVKYFAGGTAAKFVLHSHSFLTSRGTCTVLAWRLLTPSESMMACVLGYGYLWHNHHMHVLIYFNYSLNPGVFVSFNMRSTPELFVFSFRTAKVCGLPHF